MKKKLIIIFNILFICFKIFAQTEDDLYSLLIQKNNFWINNKSTDILYYLDNQHIKEYYPNIESLNYYDDAEEKKVYWYEQSCFSCITIKKNLYRNKDVISFTHGNYTDLLSFYFELEEIKGSFYYLRTEKTFNCKQNENTNSFSKWPIEEDECEMILKFDGDYLYVYLNDLKTLYGTFCRINNATLDEYNKLIRTGKCDLSKVTWPRHADGTCDYDGSKSSPSSKTTPTTNVAVNKTMTAYENLKLRSGEATTTSVLTVMAAGTKVKILQLGKAEKIDGINSNWVKIEIISGKDRDGKTIKAGTVGWCYGGYLK